MTDQIDQPSALSGALRESRRTLIGLAVFSMFINLLMLTGPLYMLQVYDRVLASGSIPTLISLTVLIFVLYATLGGLDWIRRSLFSIVAARFEDRLADDVMSASLSASLNEPGQPSGKPMQDLRTVRSFLSGSSLGVIFDVPWSPLFFLALFMMHWAFGLWALFGVAVLIALALLNRTLTQSSLKTASEREQEATTLESELNQNVEVLEAMGMRQSFEKRWRSIFDDADEAQRQSNHMLGGFSAIIKAFRLFLQSAILGLGAWLAIIGQSTPGAMIAASILMGRAIAPIEQLVGQWRSFAATRRAWIGLSGTLDAMPEATTPMQLPPISGKVEFVNVSAGPPGASHAILKNISLLFDAGDVVGIIGASAAGKSTFAKVLAGIWPARVGEVRIDGAGIAAWTREMLGPQIGYLPQYVDLFSGSVRENISRFEADADPERVIAAAKGAECHELILGLPSGYDTEIGRNGAYLSAGQRQRIGLARALFGDPNLVILDEPNSNLDSLGDEALQSAILGLQARGATTIIIAHRPSAIAHCNKLLVLNAGEVVMFGPRDEVMAKISSDQASADVSTGSTGGKNV